MAPSPSPGGRKVTGFITYTEAGRVSVVFAKCGRPPLSSDDRWGGSPAEKAGAYDTCTAYAGHVHVRRRDGDAPRRGQHLPEPRRHGPRAYGPVVRPPRDAGDGRRPFLGAMQDRPVGVGEGVGPEALSSRSRARCGVVKGPFKVPILAMERGQYCRGDHTAARRGARLALLLSFRPAHPDEPRVEGSGCLCRAGSRWGAFFLQS